MFLNKPDINSGSAIARNIRSSAYLLICLSSSSSCTTFSDFRFSPSLVSKMSASFMIVSLFVRISEICCLLLHQLRRARALLLLFESKKTSHLTALFNAVVLKRIWLRILIVTNNIHVQIQPPTQTFLGVHHAIFPPPRTTFVGEERLRDEPLRTFAWEARPNWDQRKSLDNNRGLDDRGSTVQMSRKTSLEVRSKERWLYLQANNGQVFILD